MSQVSLCIFFNKNSLRQIIVLFFAVDFVKPVPRHSRGPGLVLAFGQGEVGQLGLGPDIFEKNKPAVVPDVDNIIDIYAGGMHTVCLTADGEVIAIFCPPVFFITYF